MAYHPAPCFLQRLIGSIRWRYWCIAGVRSHTLGCWCSLYYQNRLIVGLNLIISDSPNFRTPQVGSEYSSSNSVPLIPLLVPKSVTSLGYPEKQNQQNESEWVCVCTEILGLCSYGHWEVQHLQLASKRPNGINSSLSLCTKAGDLCLSSKTAKQKGCLLTHLILVRPLMVGWGSHIGEGTLLDSVYWL